MHIAHKSVAIFSAPTPRAHIIKKEELSIQHPNRCNTKSPSIIDGSFLLNFKRYYPLLLSLYHIRWIKASYISLIYSKYIFLNFSVSF